MFKKLTFLVVLFGCFSCEDQSSDFDIIYHRIYNLFDDDLGAAEALADSILMVVKEKNLPLEEAHLCYVKGYVHAKKGEDSKAFIMYLKAAGILKKNNKREAKEKYVIIIVNLSGILTKYHKYDEANEFIQDALIKAKEFGLESQQQKLEYNKAYNFRKSGRYNQALKAVRISLKNAYLKSDTSKILKCFNLFGLIHKDSGFFEEARTYYKYIIEHPQATEKDRARAYQNMAIAFREDKNHLQAKIYFDRALQIKKRINNAELLFSTLHDLSKWHLAYGWLDSAAYHAREAMLLYPSLLSEPETFKILHLNSEILNEQGDLAGSRAFLDSAYQEFTRFNEKQQQIIQQKDKFQLDLIIAGQEAEQEAEKELRQKIYYRWLLLGSVSCIIMLLATWRIWFNWWRKKLGKDIIEFTEFD